MTFTPAEARRRAAGPHGLGRAALRGMCRDGPWELQPPHLYSRRNSRHSRLPQRFCSAGTVTCWTSAVPTEPSILRQGHGLVFTARDRPVRTCRGWSAGAMRHGVSTVRSGRRRTLGLVLHDAA
ncbi:hypothetical protein M878_04380 [Streptomyces roseochromogenus subsp. oscitans DS 12.976]|uniref:Uncharacterized protein n=1 Tax=Streptomyces roseochromogenus subsp. oscitans DS 12.976 TaxID=1352936 RepID=V6KWM6_STRRC|nr:hypothetical protein M878_04380 [Streptomyces roseochromogenus subsp. oscitans DS 12.976]